MIVYKITNLIDGKVYIGQTIQTLNKRFKQHCVKNNCPKLFLAIKKHDSSNFKIEQIDKASSREELDNKEIYWISFFNSYNSKFGYNLTPGGKYALIMTPEQRIKQNQILKNKCKKTPVIARNINTSEEIYFESIKKVQDKLGFNPARIFGAIKRKDRRYKNFWWRKAFEQFIKPPERINYQCYPLVAINFNEKIIEFFTSLKNVQKSGFNRNCVQRSFKKNNLYKKFYWYPLNLKIMKIFLSMSDGNNNDLSSVLKTVLSRSNICLK